MSVGYLKNFSGCLIFAFEAAKLGQNLQYVQLIINMTYKDKLCSFPRLIHVPITTSF